MSRSFTIFTIAMLFCGRILAERANEGGETSLLQVATVASVNATSNQSKREETRLASTQRQEPLTIHRPHFGAQADVVEVGVFIRELYGISMQDMSFAADVVLTTAWHADDVVKLLEDGVDEDSVPTASVQGVVWLPNIEITNRAEELDVISSTLSFTRSRTAIQVDRIRGTFNCDFKGIFAFPFDQEELMIRVASTSFMSKDVNLSVVTEPPFTGISDGLLDSSTFLYEGLTMTQYEEVDGNLRKSRGQLALTVQRKTKTYSYNLIVPVSLVQTVSWCGFFLPGSMPSAMMPRIATNIIAFLTHYSLVTKVATMVPNAQDVKWVDVFMECGEVLIYGAIWLNVLTLYVHHQDKIDALGVRLDHEIRCLLPGLGFISSTLCFIWAHYGLDDPGGVVILCWVARLLIFGVLGGYGASCLYRIMYRAKDL